MKRILILFVSLSLVGCTKTVEIIDEGKEQPTSSDKELILNTIATPTKAIAEGTAVPTDNGIRFYPNFFSDISSADYSSYNNVYMFGYDTDKGVWRNYVTSSFPDYHFSPLYWPAGERVFMDYTACSFSNYVYSQNQEENSVLTVDPVKKNANRMDVNYKYSYLTGPLASSMLLKEDELKEMAYQIQAMSQLGYVNGSELEVLNKIDLEKYADAVELAQGKITIDEYLALGVRKLEGETEAEIKADAAEQINLAYWFFMNYAPRISKFMQDDLLYAHDRSLKDSNHGEVKAVFNHSKAWVKVIVNNQTTYDLFISGIRFDDVKSDGTLVIDNSKSAFEAYWDFPEEVASTGVDIDPLTEKSLDGPAVSVNQGQMGPAEALFGKQSATRAIVKGMLPDQYIIPTGCYGPALAVDKISKDDKIQALNCTYLNGGQRFDLGDTDCRTMVGRLGGMMFPAQEPGMITLRYTFWKKYLKPEKNRRGEPASTAVYSLPMYKAVGLFDTFTSSDTREISLNLPRQTWKMGKVYVYVLTISENEITINPYVSEWEYADPIFGPEETGMRTGDDPTETFTEGNTEGWFGN